MIRLLKSGVTQISPHLEMKEVGARWPSGRKSSKSDKEIRFMASVRQPGRALAAGQEIRVRRALEFRL